MVMYASDIPSLGRDVLVEIFCTGTPSTDGTFIFFLFLLIKENKN